MREIVESVIAGERERTYRFLSNLCLKPPSDSLISMIEDGSILSVVQGDSNGYSELVRFVEEASNMPDLRNELTAEHTALFVLPRGVIPHGAVFLDKEKRLGGRVTISVEQFYERAGADILKDCTEMPDHLGMELEFMGFLCKIEEESWQKGDHTALQRCIEFEKSFLYEHLLKWAFQCCESIIEHTTSRFYKALAYLIMEFLRDEEEYVAEIYGDSIASLKRGNL
ncbi:MAG: molecular chaperone TorD family protein [Nitrospirota bacterium]